MAQGRRTRHELHKGSGPEVAAQTRRDAEAIAAAWGRYLDAAAAQAAVRQCEAVWPSSVADVAPAVCQRLADHAPGEEDGGHRHRVLGSQVVVTW